MTTSTSFAQMANNQSIFLSSALRANTPPTKKLSSSRKFLTLSIFFLLSFFCTTNAWADYTITFKTSGNNNDGSQAKTAIADLISDGGGYVSTISATKAYNGKNGYGVKLGSSSEVGNVSMNLTSNGNNIGQIKASKLIVNAAYYKTGPKLKVTVTYTDNTTVSQSLSLTASIAAYDVTLSSTKTLKSIKIESVVGSSEERVYCHSIQVVAASAAPSFTITAQSNNDSFGTVSLSETTITAEPADCYQVVSGTGGYTIMSGTATVTHEGNSNTLTVNASTNCSIQVNFEKKPVNTYIDNVQDYEEQELCGNHSAPSLTDKEPAITGTCEQQHWHFMGWVTEANKENLTDANIVKANTSVTANGTTYYAVWARGEGGSSDYKLVTSTPADWSGTYLIVNAGDKKAWKGSATSDNGAIDVTITNNTITSNATTDNETFTIATMTGGYSIKGTSGKYIYGTNGSNATNYSDAAQLNTISIDNNNNVTITSNTSVLRQNNSNASLFRYYKSSTYSSQHPIQLYKKGSTTTYSDYITTCTPQATQLATPTGLNVTNITSTSATLSWDAVANAKWYEIKTGNSLIVSTGSTSSGLSNLEPSTKYTYCVYAVADGYTNSEETCVTFTTATAPAKVVNWSVKGVEHTTEFNGQSTAIYQPTGDELTCGEKKFVGWTATKNYENATTAPTDLFITTLPNGLTNGTTFYAVYADTRATTSITYTWDLVQQSTDPALAVGDQIVIAAKDYDYALSTTQNTDNRGAVSVTKDGDKITIDNKVQIFTLENGNEEGTFALATGDGYLSGTRRKAGRNYYNQLITATSKSANTSWYIGFTEETTPYIYNEVSEKKNGSNYEYPNYYVGFNYNYDWWTGTYNYYFEAVRDASTWYDYNPENISIYRRTKYENTTTVNSGYTTDCGCSEPQTPLSINDAEVVVNTELDLASLVSTGGTGGRISQYYCSDAAHTTIANGHIFSANALGTYEITATQETSNGACETTATFTVTVTCATPSITPTTHSTTINTPVDLKSIITSTSTMPLTFACTEENVYISGTNFTFLADDTYTIIATQAAGGIYCNGSQEITITVTDPCAGKTKPSVTATANETTITVVWDALDDVTTYRIYNNTTGDSDETTDRSYTFGGLNPSTEYSWTVEAVYSDDCTAATSGTTTTSTPVVTYTVNWNVAGSGYNIGTPTTSVIHGEKVSDLPTTPNPAEHSCGDKVFVGWSKSQFVDGTRPADLFTDVAGSPAITAATTFYAVFADCVTDGGDDTPEDDTQGEWTLVTDVNDLQAGDKIIIACYSKEKAASNLTSAILSVDADVTFSNSGNTLTPSASTLIFTLGGSTGAWTFANSSGQLLGATAVKKLAWDGGTTTWSISISGTEATISNTNNSYGRFLYNVGSPRFTTYTSGTSESMLLPQIYKKTGSGSGGGETPEPEEYTVTLSVLGETSEENTTSNYTLPIDVDASCAGKTFVGWTTTKDLSSSTEPASNYWAKGTMVTITEDKTYYAVFAEGTNTFEWVTTGVESGADYLLAGYYGGNDYVLKNTLDSYGYIETVNINASDNIITTSDNSLIWTIAGNSTFGYYIYNPASDKYLNIDAPFTLDGTAKTRYSITMSKDADNYVQSYIKYGNDYCYLCNDNTIGTEETEASIYLYKRAYSDYSTTCESGGTDPDPETTYTVSFNAGTGTCTTQSLKETSEGAGVTLPTATGCGDWTFAGWATASVIETTTAPTLLAAGNNYKPNSNTTLYAVYSKTESGGGGGGGTLTISSNSMGTSTGYGSDDFEVDGVTFKRSSWGKQQNGSNYYLQGKTYNAFYNEDPISGAITKIVVDRYGGTGTLYIGTSKTPTSNEQTIDSDKTFNFAENNNYQYIRVYSTSTLQITSITITYAASGSSTTYYNSNPDCESGGDTGGDSGEDRVVFSDDLQTEGSNKIESKEGWNSLTNIYAYESGTQSGIRIATSSNSGSITTNPLTNVNGTNATLLVEFDAVGWGDSEKTLSVSVTNGTASETDLTLNNVKGSSTYTSEDHYSFTITGASSSTKVTWSAADRAIIANVVITQLSTPASAPARKVAMKKAAAVRVEKSEMVTRPVVKAPAALAAQECTSYENYTTICCANPITDLKFAAGANSITLYWNTVASSATATLYNDEECKSQVTGATQTGITNGTCTFTGLAKTTTYYAKVTTTDGCTAVLEVSTERPIVSVAEWAATQINIDINTNEPIKVYLENEVTGGSQMGNQATELFFSKYYEATANVKLVAVYNGKAEAIDLTNYTIKYGKTAWATNYIPLAEFATTANGFALEGHLSPGEEMILYTKNVSDSRDVAIMECVNEAYPDGKWIEVTTTNNTGKGSLSFGGDKTIALFKGGTMIDIIGGGTASKPDNSGASTKPTWGDAKGWTCDEGLSIDDGTMIGISTNRCLLVRNNTVTSGENAVNSNTTNFVTLCTEWKGAHVPDDDIDDGVSESCENFAFVGTFDYSDYYVKYEELASSEELPADGRLEDGTYMIITPDLHDLACTNMRISVKSATDGTTLVTQDYKVPIIVDEDISTNNPIYFQYTQRTDVNVKPNLGGKNENVLTPDICADCDIVIRDSKTLTHVEDGKGQFRNMMVYPNAKMDNQAAKPFNLNTLQMQGKNDEVSYAIIENDGSTIDVGDMVFVKRIDDKYWYNFSLPYDCKVTDIIQQNGQSMGKYWVDWGIKEYDGKARQEGGNSAGAGNVGLYWKKVEETATLKAHQGYIIGLFTTEWTNQMKFVYFTPINTNPYRESGDDAKNTTIDGWYTSKTVAARHRGWNFTGSPYISRFGQSTAGQGLNNTSLIMTGYPEPENNDVTEYETYTENVYVTIPSTQGGKYYSHSVASGVQLLPFTAYFVQAADVSGEVDEKRELTYDKRGRAFPASAPARAIATKQRVLVELLVTAPDGQTDNTGVWVDERYTPEYEIAADLGKMYVAGAKPQLYTLAENGEMMAYHALPDACAMNIPLRLYAPKAGDYTLTLNQRVSRLAGAERIELLYNNAVVANMMLQDYTITTNRGTVNGYSLSITRRADVSTAIDNITGTAITVIANDGYISVTDIPTDAQVSVYDMLGRLLTTQSANGQTVVNIPAVPQGVYNIVVGNNNGHTTIKTVIK